MKDYRAEILEIAKAEIGPQAKGSAKVLEYWRAVLPPSWSEQQLKQFAAKAEWCGGFALWCLKRAGLAKDVFWEVGKGFLYRLKTTRTPSRGDVGYLAQPFQHHLLFDYEYDGWCFSTDGNQPGVSEKRRRRDGLTFYSIQSLIDAALPEDERSTNPAPKMPTVWQGHCDPITAMELQRLLVAKGFPVKVDGIFGKLTAEAVRKFQLVNGLTTDGIVGERSWLCLMT
jgi:peptidoglycan hydrolase-like protein with peptidoglycan-binding domain